MGGSNVSEKWRNNIEQLAKIQDQGMLKFTWRTWVAQVMLTLLMLPVALLINWACVQAGLVPAHDTTPDIIAEFGIPMALFYGIILGPLLETVVFQICVIEIVRLFTKRLEVQLLFSAFLFALAHFHNSLLSGLLAGIPGGFVLGIVYLVGRQRGFLRATGGTWLAHAAWNAPLLIAAALFA